MDQSLRPSDSFDLGRVARLVRPFEILETTAVPRPGGGWAIGYGHVRSARAGAQVTRDEAEALLLYDLRHVADVVRAAIYAPVHRNQLEALIAFAFHIGTERFLTSTTLHRFNAGDSLGAAQELERWCCADIGADVQVVDALVRRRAAEKAHFLTPPEGFPKASRARLQPQFEASSPGVSPETEVPPSATLAAAHSVSARLRALVPDPATDLPLDIADPAELQPATFEPTPAPHTEPESEPEPEPELLSAAVAPSEPEIPPPPMPFEAASSYAPHPAPPHTPAEGGPSDPFAQGPLEEIAIEAPPLEALELDRMGTGASLFRPQPQPRAEIPPRPEPRKTASPRAASSKSVGQKLFETGVPRSWLWAVLAIGLGIFVWSIWSIVKTTPSPVNFIAGLVGIAVMAAPAYLLLGARDR